MIPFNPLIINYHKIEKKSDFGITTRRPEDFCEDLDCLVSNGYTSITFSDLLTGSKLPGKSIIITFDDGYLSFYENAFRSLLSRNMRAVVFVPVNYIGKTNNWDVQLLGKNYLHMDKTQLKIICDNGMEIGSHTLRHIYLNNLSDKILERELNESKTKLEEIVNNTVQTVSYPFGRFNKRVLAAAKKYYTFGVQQMHNPYVKQGLEKLSLQRINIYRTDSRKSFINKLNYPLKRAVRLKSRILQLGSWATVIQQSIKNHENKRV